jgi:hypothetical protein
MSATDPRMDPFADATALNRVAPDLPHFDPIDRHPALDCAHVTCFSLMHTANSVRAKREWERIRLSHPKRAAHG